MISARLTAAVLLVLSFLAGGRAHGQTLQEGLQYLKRAQYARAEAVFKALAASEASAEADLRLADFYLATGRPELARPAVESAIARDPKAPLAHVALGELEIAQGNPAGAEDHFEQAKRLSRQRNADVFHHIGVAQLRHAAKDPAAAEAALRKAIELDPKRADYFIALGDAHRAARQPGPAATAYEQALYAEPGSAEALVRIGDLYADAQTHAEALKQYNEAVAADPGFLPAYRSLGEIYFLAKQYDRAAASYGRYVVEAEPTADDRFVYAGYLYLSGRHADALAELRKLGADYPNPVRNRLLAYTLYETKQFAEGLGRMEAYLGAAQPDQVLASDHEYHGRLLLAARGDTLAAIAGFRKAIESDSSRQGLQRDIAALYFTSRRYAESAAEYEALEASGAGLTATDLLNQGKAYYYGRVYDRAEAAFGRITETAPTAALGWLWRARAAARLDPESSQGLARPFYLKYVELTTDPSKAKRELVEANFYLGYYHYLRNEPDLSRPYLQAVIALDPAHADARALAEALGAPAASTDGTP